MGSFINALVYRTQNKKTMLSRSACPKCQQIIRWYDNIPLISYLVLRGKCRNCKKKISIQYPIIELTTGIAFALVAVYSTPGIVLSNWISKIFNLKFEIFNQFLILNSILLFLLLLITITLLLIAVYDFKTKEIPNGYNLAFILSCSLYLLISTLIYNPDHLSLFPYHLLTGSFLFLTFWALVYFSKETWMGGGDAKFVFGMGLLLGPFNSILAILIASISGSIYGISGLIKNSKISNLKLTKNFKFQIKNSHQVPFGPFLALGTFVSLIFGSQIVSWYVKIFLGI